MRAVVLTGHGGPGCLSVYEDVLVPNPVAGQVLVEVAAASVNNTDLWTRQGAYGLPGDPDALAGWRGPLSFPRIQGGDVVGLIRGCGPGVNEDRIGERVLVDPCLYDGDGDDASPVGLVGSEVDGGFADYLVVDADRAHNVDDAPLSDEQLACVPIAYGTAMGMLERGAIMPAETVLVTGASGGVGLALVQLAAARGARVVALTSADKHEQVEAAGAFRTVLRSDPDLAGQLAHAAPDGLDAVTDVAAGTVLETAFPALKDGGRWVIAGAVAGPVVTFDFRRLYLHQRRIVGSSMHTPAHFRHLIEQVRRGSVQPAVAATYPLEDIHHAQRVFVHGHYAGKLVLRP